MPRGPFVSLLLDCIYCFQIILVCVKLFESYLKTITWLIKLEKDAFREQRVSQLIN